MIGVIRWMVCIGGLLIEIESFFLTNPRLSMMVRIFDKMKVDRKKMILSEADKFIKLNTA